VLTEIIKQPCTLLLAADADAPDVEADQYGNVDTADPDAYAEVSTVCHLQQRRRAEEGDQGETSDTTWEAFFLPGESMGDRPSANKLTVGAQTFEFVGDPWLASDPEPGGAPADHWEATLRVTA